MSGTPGPVTLRVSDPARALAFWRDTLGTTEVADTGAGTALATGEGEPPLIRLAPEPASRPRPPRTTGLFHVALLHPDRASLAATLRRLLEARVRFQGFSDHGVSEAAYLADPDGNGLELYVDRAPEAWPRDGAGGLAMFTDPLDLDDLLSTAPGPADALPAGTRVGHVHLQVSDLAPAEAFYADALGMDVTTRGYPGALFLSYGGYHHHVGVNVWAGVGAPRPPAGSTGLVEWSLVMAGPEAVAAALARIRSRGFQVRQAPDAAPRAEDPDGNVVALLEASRP